MTSGSTISKASVDYPTARAMVEAALAHADHMGCDICVAVVDCSGQLLAFGRDDAAALMGIEGCQRKATTGLLGIGSAEFYEAIKADDGTVHGLSHLPGSIMVPGGLPITVEGAVVGGIGVSGALPEQDVACAEAAIAALFGA